MYTSTVSNQRQIRVFVVAWLGITLLMGALTFAGIYYASGLVDNNDNNGNTVNAAAIKPDSSGDGVGSTSPQDATPIPSPTPLGGAAPAAPAANPTPRPVDDTTYQLGIQVQQNPEESVYQMWMGEVRDKLKLGWIKQQVRWENIEPQPGQYEWGALDVTFSLASEYDIKVMVSVVTTPAWAREQGNQLLDEVGPPGDPQVFANFLTAMLQRYPGQIHAVEVWNEMNLRREWASIYGLSASKYIEMLRVARDAIKAVDPGIIVISGALAPTGVNDGVVAYDDYAYLDMLIQGGLLDIADCVGAHHNGYNIGPNVPWDQVPNDPSAIFRGPFDNAHHSWSFYSTLNTYAQKIQQAGSSKKLCITEFGWASSEDLGGGPPVNYEYSADNTLAEQSAFLDEAIRLMDDWGFVWLAFIWNLNYGPQAGWDPYNDNVPYSLLRPDWTPAPAYNMIAQYNFRER